MMKRLLDLFIALICLMVFVIPIFIVAILVKATSIGPALHWSKRIGQYNKLFLMPKFRTMFLETPQVATHLLSNPDAFLTPIGKFLRKTSLDELPQIYSVLVGDMSFVGPRPALFNQDDLIALRTAKGIDKLKPGVTGWAQVNGRDDLSVPIKVEFDLSYLQNRNIFFDIKILFMTAVKVIKSDGIKH